MPMFRWVPMCKLSGSVAIAVSCAFSSLPAQVATVAAASDAVTDPAIQSMLDRPVTLQLDNVSLKKALDAVAEAARVNIGYRGTLVAAVKKPVSVHAAGVPLGDVLSGMLQGTGLQAVPYAKGQISVAPLSIEKQVVQGVITGKVVNAETKRPIIGATVWLHEMEDAVTTDENGHFRLPAVVGEHIVHIRAIGMAQVTRRVTVKEGVSITLDIELSPSAKTLDQVVVTGTVVETELKRVPNAITVITAKDLEERGITQIDQLFRGDVPGLFALNLGSNNALGAVTMFSRGATYLPNSPYTFATNTIKTYVDGVELADPQYLSQIDPASIERIEILTGPQASTIYGSNAINGVMQIFTKRGGSGSQLRLGLMAGFVENDFTRHLTPQHDHSAQLSGMEGRASYTLGASYVYVGPWTPSKRTARLSGSGGSRVQFGRWAVDGSFRVARTRNFAKAYATERGAQRLETLRHSLAPSTRGTLRGRTLGLTLDYRLTSWWSHQARLGSDVADVENSDLAPAFRVASDTLMVLSTVKQQRTSLQYRTTAYLPMTQQVQATLTAGADGWRSDRQTIFARSGITVGSLNNPSVNRSRPGRNAGAFFQGQLDVFDALFFTYGIRAEWNPTFGDDVQPNMAPRYGVAYTRDIGKITVKVRGSYGRSTRPPSEGQKEGRRAAGRLNRTLVGEYGNFFYELPNPRLLPESQQGGEGGLELYFGNVGSLVITRFNQTVDNLIAQPMVDSVRSLLPFPSIGSLDSEGYGWYLVNQNVNIGTVRNQGWEIGGNATFGPLTAGGTYSWVKSRIVGGATNWRFPSWQYEDFAPGRSFSYLPEHTWAANFSYAHAATTLSLNLNGTGLIYIDRDDRVLALQYTRLDADMLQMRIPPGYRSVGGSYTMADMSISHRISPAIEGVLHVQNLTNYYQSDYSALHATIGRQTKFGLRIHL